MSPSRQHLDRQPGTSGSIDSELLLRVQEYLLAARVRFPPTATQRAAWETFYEACNLIIRKSVDRLRVPPDDRKDCIQIVWQEITKAIPHFKVPVLLSSFD